MKQHLLYLATLALLAACSADDAFVGAGDAGAPGKSQELHITATIGAPQGTRLAQTAETQYQFDTSDQIGVFIVKAGTDLSELTNTSNPDVWLSNKMFTVDSIDTATGKCRLAMATSGDDQQRFWPKATTNEQKYDVYAYYPYIASITSQDGTVCTDRQVPADQRAAQLKNMQFLMVSKQVQRLDEFSLTFKPVLAAVDITLSAGQLARLGGEEANKSVSLTGVANTYTAQFAKIGADGTPADPVVTAGTATTEVKMQAAATAQATTFRAIMPAQTIAAGAAFTLVNTAAPTVSRLALHTLGSDLTVRQQYIEPYAYDSNTAINAAFPVAKPTTAAETSGNRTINGNSTVTFDAYNYSAPITNQQYCDFLNAVMATANNTSASTDWYATCATVAGFSQAVAADNALVYCSDKRDGAAYNWGVRYDISAKKWLPVAGQEANPVRYVTWYGARAYADWAYCQLPTEAQWENLAIPYDGNLWEWTADAFSTTYPNGTYNPTSPATAGTYVYRNGEQGYYTAAGQFRSDAAPAHTYAYLGFRVVK